MTSFHSFLVFVEIQLQLLPCLLKGCNLLIFREGIVFASSGGEKHFGEEDVGSNVLNFFIIYLRMESDSLDHRRSRDCK